MHDDARATLAAAQETAREAQASLARAHDVLAHLATSLGRDDEAVAHARRADVHRCRVLEVEN